jgi:hypothetical protein
VGPVLSQAGRDVPVHANYIINAVHPPRDASLVGDHCDRDTDPIEPANCFRCPSMTSTRSTEPPQR